MKRDFDEAATSLSVGDGSEPAAPLSARAARPATAREPC